MFGTPGPPSLMAIVELGIVIIEQVDVPLVHRLKMAPPLRPC